MSGHRFGVSSRAGPSAVLLKLGEFGAIYSRNVEWNHGAAVQCGTVRCSSYCWYPPTAGNRKLVCFFPIRDFAFLPFALLLLLLPAASECILIGLDSGTIRLSQ